MGWQHQRDDPLLALTASYDDLLSRAEGCIERGEYAEAARLLRRALRHAEKSAGENALEVAFVLNQLGVACKFAGDFDEAEQCYARAMDIVEHLRGHENEMMATLLHNVGGLAHSRGRFAEGLGPAREGLAMRERLTGPESIAVAADGAALAAILEGLDEPEEAVSLYERALAVLDAAGERHDAAMTRNGLGSACQALERFAEAEEHYRSALAQLEEIHGPDHPSIGHVLNNLATLHRRRGEDTEARALLARAQDLLERTLGPEHPVTIEVAGNRARVDASPSPYV